MGFERIEALLAALGNPERSLRVVQVVGTNGKGTTSVALSAALEVMGETTGTYLSPHVTSYAERVRLRGAQVTEEAFAEGMGKVIAVADELGIEVTQFELLTAGALLMFRDAGVTWAVMEAGLGARYDATTAARPEAVVLTNVALDHTEYLGDTVAEIATEKLASVPENGTLILGTDDPEVIALARSRTEAVSARLVEVMGLPSNSSSDSELPAHVFRNVRVGCAAAETLAGKALSEDEFALVEREISGVLPGRFEVVMAGETRVILDGGHNVEGLRATLRAVRESHYPGGLCVVFGVLRDKNIEGMLNLLGEAADSLYLTRPDDVRAAEPGDLLSVFQRVVLPNGLRSGGDAISEPDIPTALRLALREAGASGVVLVTGSFTTVAGVRKDLGL